MTLIRKSNHYNQPQQKLSLAFRVLPRIVDTGVLNKSGTKTKKRIIDSMQVMNMHLRILDDKINDFVYYSTDISISAAKAKQIDTMVFFSYKDQWAAVCEVEVIVNGESTVFTPEDVSEKNTVEEWRTDICPTWIKIKSYEQVEYETLNNYKITNSNKSNSKYLGDLINHSKRFSRAYIEI